MSNFSIIKTLLKHEMMSLFKSRRVIWSVSIFLILFAIVFSLRVKDFDTRRQNYIADQEVVQKENENASNYSFLGVGVVKKPTLASIFHEGHTHSFGTFVKVKLFDPIFGAENRTDSSNYIYDFPTRMDITYLITFFLSLFVLIISFDSINGEKEQGTLRMLFVYPVKRFQFIIKKVVGSISFVAFVFGIPYILSVGFLLLKYPQETGFAFFQFVFVYFIYALIYLFTITLIGLLLSTITKSSARSLIFALLFWVMFSIIIPISYEYFSDYINNKNRLKQIAKQRLEISERRNKHALDLPYEIDPEQYSHQNWNGGWLTDVSVYGAADMYNAHIGYVKHYYDVYYPEVKEDEQLKIESIRIKYNHERMMPYFMFFNPNVLFEDAAESISMTRIDDYINFIQSAITTREDLTNQFIQNDWLFSRNYICTFDTSEVSVPFDSWIMEGASSKDLKKYYPTYNTNKEGRKKLLEYMSQFNGNSDTPQAIMDLYGIYMKGVHTRVRNLKPFELLIPNLPKPDQNNLNIGLIVERTLPNIILLVIVSLILMVLINNYFKKFDLR